MKTVLTLACTLLMFFDASAQNFGLQELKIIDADTIHITQQGQKIKVRLYGIDAPEKKQEYGNEATTFLTTLLQGKDVFISPITKDRYGRVVAMVYVEGENVQEILLKNGLAWMYPNYCSIDVCEDWAFLQTKAKDTKKGLWQNQNPVPPWVWRKNSSR